MRLRRLSSYLLGTVSILAVSLGAKAADWPVSHPTALPAVSAVNGKWELDAGSINNPSGGVFRGSGSLSLPLGEQFGIQGDVTLGDVAGSFSGGGALHVFTRDPSRYLLGITGGVVAVPGASLWAIGPEAELYRGRFSFEAWGGYATASYSAPSTSAANSGFFIGDVAYYPNDNWRLALGGSYVLGNSALHIGSEYLFHDGSMPLSWTLDARIGSTTTIATIGIKGYFGGNDANKSLINRQRQDDPRNKALDLFNAVGSLQNPGTAEDPEQACQADGNVWIYNNETQDYECVAP